MEPYKMSQLTLEGYLNEQQKKLEQLAMATTFIRSKENDAVASELVAAKSEVSSIRNSLNSARDNLEKMKNQNESMKSLLNTLDKLRKEIRHMEANVPPELLHDYANIQLHETNYANQILRDTPNYRSEGSDSSDNVFQQDQGPTINNCKKILFNKPSSPIPRISLLESEEYKLIPKYMIGRQSLDTVNQFLGTINDILNSKYALLALGKNGARKKGEFDLYMSYLKQECVNEKEKEKGKVYFFTAEDYQRHTKTKLDKTKLNLLTVLRHCKRLREVRAAKAIQYTVVLS